VTLLTHYASFSVIAGGLRATLVSPTLPSSTTTAPSVQTTASALTVPHLSQLCDFIHTVILFVVLYIFVFTAFTTSPVRTPSTCGAELLGALLLTSSARLNRLYRNSDRLESFGTSSKKLPLLTLSRAITREATRRCAQTRASFSRAALSLQVS